MTGVDPMPWHYRDPMTFPASYHSAVLNAAKLSPKPILFLEASSREEAKALQDRFRWFRWCAKHEASAATEVRLALENYDFRCSFEVTAFKLLLYVRARPTLLGEFELLNPEIAKEILPIVNT